MTERTGAVAYRHLAARAVLTGTGDGDSLQNVDTTPLNDGCLVYVQSLHAYYMLDRSSTVSPLDGALNLLVVVPVNGPGRWFLFNMPNNSAFWAAVSMILTPQALVITTQSTWVNPPAVTNAYALSSAGFNAFTLDASTGLLTYNGGTSRDFLVSVNASIAPATNVVQSVEVVPDTGALVGTTTDNFFAGRTSTQATIDREAALSAFRVFTLAQGDVLRPVFRNLTGTDDLSIERLSWSVTALV